MKDQHSGIQVTVDKRKLKKAIKDKHILILWVEVIRT